MKTATSRGAIQDDKLQALEDFRAELKPRLAPGLSISRDNPGRTPPAWSIRDVGGKALLTFGLVDRTFFWSWDNGDSNHYVKDTEVMRAVILSELVRFRHTA